MMERVNSTLSLARTKSDQLAETLAAAVASMKSPPSSNDSGTTIQGVVAEGSSGPMSRRSSKRMTIPSPGRSSTHIRKSRSAQLKHELDHDMCSGAALSRASSASLGLSFSLTGYIMPPEEMADSKPFSDEDDIPEDIEAGTSKKKIQAEPTLPIFLKAGKKERKSTTYCYATIHNLKDPSIGLIDSH